MRRAVLPLIIVVACLAWAAPANAKTYHCAPVNDAPGSAPCLVDASGDIVRTPEYVSFGLKFNRRAVAVRWAKWGGSRTIGKGTWEYPGPDGYVDVPFRVTLDQLRPCAGKPFKVYSRIRVEAVRSRDAKRIPRDLRTPTTFSCSAPEARL